MLILHDLEPYHWAVAGAAIGAMVLALLYITNKRFGVSTGFESACSLVLRATPYFQRDSLRESNPWRLAFLAGLVLGGVLSASLGGGWEPTWDMGMHDTHLGMSEGGKVLWMFSGGALIGFGTRLAGGCTSGHGIFGISNLEKASFVSVAAFMIAGVVVTNVFWRLFVGL